MIQNIWAVGRNYAEHAKELGNEVPTEPLVFLKAGSCATLAAKEIHLPTWGTDIHHEVELALQFDDNLQIDEACVALDLTERAKQAQLKAKGQPWTLAKSFKEACPLSGFFTVNDLEELKALDIILKVNGDIRQKGNTNQMIFTLEALIDFVRQHFPVMPGDLLLTGTPAGVGPLKAGDVAEAEIVGKITHKWLVK
ncbi:fumarylacetoacetate hydrolase family protein [Bdellovibrio svalbardensis]|uniref:Fumarylacetoacetate hydrolase family protein n=1 Tax=Bdellovibrio svalbardensis TaxID=2972972 RepID=A0ABT6DLN8_9BACT|nr:fumarylacetoacetate hydrolase family protein [Bdellovibrio svalbardensis]MDG0817796.1 fumarylacetoacetate hydrolase family protein [Bdellovibrio svalbardensis]